MTGKRGGARSRSARSGGRARTAAPGSARTRTRTKAVADSPEGEDDDHATAQPAGTGKWKIGKDGRRAQWQAAAYTAEALGITPRWLAKLENKGMPAEGFRDSCRYPWPHAVVWYAAYQRALARDKSVEHLDIEDAMKQYDISNAIADVEFEYRLCADPTLRETLLAYVSDSDEDSPRNTRLRYFAARARGAKSLRAGR